MFHIAQHEYLAIFSIERAQRLRQPLPHFFALQRLRRNLAPVGKTRRRVRTLLVTAVVETFHGHSSLPSPAHQSLVHRDLDQPRAEAGLGAKLPDIRERLQHRLLRRVLGVLLIAQNRKSRGINSPFIRPNQFVKQFMLAALHARDQVLLTRAHLHRIVQHHLWFGHCREVASPGAVLGVSCLAFPNTWDLRPKTRFNIPDLSSIPSAWKRNCSSRAKSPSPDGPAQNPGSPT